MVWTNIQEHDSLPSWQLHGSRINLLILFMHFPSEGWTVSSPYQQKADEGEIQKKRDIFLKSEVVKRSVVADFSVSDWTFIFW